MNPVFDALSFDDVFFAMGVFIYVILPIVWGRYIDPKILKRKSTKKPE
jgi:hypothetical protein